MYEKQVGVYLRDLVLEAIYPSHIIRQSRWWKIGWVVDSLRLARRRWYRGARHATHVAWTYASQASRIAAPAPTPAVSVVAVYHLRARQRRWMEESSRCARSGSVSAHASVVGLYTSIALFSSPSFLSPTPPTSSPSSPSSLWPEDSVSKFAASSYAPSWQYDAVRPPSLCLGPCTHLSGLFSSCARAGIRPTTVLAFPLRQKPRGQERASRRRDRYPHTHQPLQERRRRALARGAVRICAQLGIFSSSIYCAPRFSLRDDIEFDAAHTGFTSLQVRRMVRSSRKVAARYRCFIASQWRALSMDAQREVRESSGPNRWQICGFSSFSLILQSGPGPAILDRSPFESAADLRLAFSAPHNTHICGRIFRGKMPCWLEPACTSPLSLSRRHCTRICLIRHAPFWCTSSVLDLF